MQNILLKRSLGKNGKAQKFFTHEIRRCADPYVPFRDGPLKNTAVEEPKRLTYVQPYAKKQWYTNKGNGKRGAKWVTRMWTSRGKEIVKSVANYCGGRSS